MSSIELLTVGASSSAAHESQANVGLAGSVAACSYRGLK